jgi:hypothetical protein
LATLSTDSFLRLPTKARLFEDIRGDFDFKDWVSTPNLGCRMEVVESFGVLREGLLGGE